MGRGDVWLCAWIQRPPGGRPNGAGLDIFRPNIEAFSHHDIITLCTCDYY